MGGGGKKELVQVKLTLILFYPPPPLFTPIYIIIYIFIYTVGLLQKQMFVLFSILVYFLPELILGFFYFINSPGCGRGV